MSKITIERETLERAISALDNDDLDPLEVVALLHDLRAALAAQPAEQSIRPLPDHDNHHNALKCPYCNPRGLKFAEPVAQCPVKSYWLIECKNGFTGWYTNHRLDCRFFDTDPRKAYKFASKELAENEISERGHSCMIATEHVDIAAQPAEAVAWINRRVIYDPATDSVTGYGEPELSFERASYGYDYANAKPLVLAQPAPAAVPLTDEKIDHTLATTLDEFARTTRGMSHALDVNADITANSRLRRMFARAMIAAAGDKP